jgi:outer membrane receptor protein involved in Fe transport
MGSARRTDLRQLALAASAFTALTASATLAAPAPATVAFDLPPGSLAGALEAFAAQSHQSVIFDAGTVAGHRFAGFHGSAAPAVVLQRLLQGSALTVEQTGPKVFVLKARSIAGEPSLHRIAMAQPTPVDQSSVEPTAPPSPTVQNPSPSDTPPAEVVVTGTHIRGVKAIASPTVEITQDDLRRDGDATIAEGLSKLPQVFNGQSTPNTYLVGSDSQGTNASAASGVNLRGLGASATLVLMNGRRLAGTGTLGDFTDVSAIPTAAVDHVEVLLDGASAIYGSDAVGGVVNLVMKKDFEGAETSARIGEDAGGVGASGQISQTFGFRWDGGHVLLALEYQHDDPLSAASRPYTANTNLTALGGTNHDTIYSDPGNILAINAAGTAYISEYAIPGGSGIGLTPSSFLAGQTNPENGRLGTDILPEQDRSSVYLDAQQSLGPKTTLDLEARYNLHVFQYNAGTTDTAFIVTPANPYYVSPNSAPYEIVGYATDVTGPERATATSLSWDVSAGLDQDLGRTWRLSAYAGFAEEDGRDFISNVWNSSNLNEALGNGPDVPAVGYFNPYGNGSSNSKAVLSYIDDGYAWFTDMSQISTLDIQADGTLFTIPGGSVKGAFGAQYRHERFEGSEYSFASDTPYVQAGPAYTRDVTGVFGELQVPLVGAANALPGVQRLDLSIAGRVEHYDDVGTTTNPKLGVVWVPIHDVKVHATYGTSFRAPSLPEVHQPTSYYPTPIAEGASTVLALEEVGGNPQLKPQTATTWTAGIDYSPHEITGLRVGVSWFSIDFKNQISTPGVNILEAGLDAPAYASLVTHIDPNNPVDEALIAGLLAKAPASTSSLYPASAYSAIIDDRYVNASAVSVAGVDFNADYSFKLGANAFDVFGTGSWLYDYSERVTAAAPSQQLVSTPNYPVDFRGRLTGVWTRGPYSIAATLNYVNSYRDPVANRTIDAWTTADLSATWTPGPSHGPLAGLVVTAAVQNLFDQDPPFYDSPNAVGYDPANANPLGRVVSLQVSKRW